MIDFNDTTPPAEHNRESERDEIRADLLARLESVLTTMFPAGKKRRGKFLIGDILGIWAGDGRKARGSSKFPSDAHLSSPPVWLRQRRRASRDADGL